MSGFWLPSTRIAQPQDATKASPQIGGLAHLWASNVIGSGPGIPSIFDAAGSAYGYFGVGSPSSLTGNNWSVYSDGWGIVFSDSGTGSIASPVIKLGDSSGSGGPSGNTFSIIARVNLASVSSTQAIYASGANGIEFRVNGGGTLSLLKTTVAGIGTSSGSITSGADFDIGVSYDGSKAQFYINGVASGSGTSAQTFTLNQQFFLGCYRSAGDLERILNGSIIKRVAVFNYPLPSTYFQSLAGIGFWQLFEDELTYIPIGGVAPYPTLSNIRFNPATTTGGYFSVDLS
jgi:Concanavalin A-like lectin/glucanases superfamily